MDDMILGRMMHEWPFYQGDGSGEHDARRQYFPRGTLVNVSPATDGKWITYVVSDPSWKRLTYGRPRYFTELSALEQLAWSH